MPISQSEKEWLEGLFEAYDGNEKMVSEWAQGFMTDQIDRMAKYGADMHVSSKQWGVLNRAAADIGYEGPSAGGEQSPPDDSDEIPY